MKKERKEAKDGNTAVLSSRQLKGVVPVDRRKRKVSEAQEIENKKEKNRVEVKYIGETSRSAYERIKEHYNDYENLSVKSHMLKHYVEKHIDLERKEVKFKVKVLRSYHSAFERQIGESVIINHNLRQGTTMMNSKNEYNRCIIPRLGINSGKDEWEEEYEESENEKMIKREIQRMKEKLRYGKQLQKEKKIKPQKENKEINKEKKRESDLVEMKDGEIERQRGVKLGGEWTD